MAFLTSMNIVGSGLTAQQLRLDVVSENITNMNTTRTEGGGAYRRKMVVFQAQDGIRSVTRWRSEACPAMPAMKRLAVCGSRRSRRTSPR